MSVNDSTYRAILSDGGTVLERVLLGIIRAHTTPETEGREHERLNMAITMLIGPTPTGRVLYEKALLFMMRQRQHDVCNLEMAVLRQSNHCAPRVRSNRELAEVAAREVMGCAASHEIRIAASRLCELFSQQRIEPNYVQETLETEAVKRLCDEFAEWDVPTRP